MMKNLAKYVGIGTSALASLFPSDISAQSKADHSQNNLGRREFLRNIGLISLGTVASSYGFNHLNSDKNPKEMDRGILDGTNLEKNNSIETERDYTSREEVGNMFSHQITETDGVWNSFRSKEERINKLEEKLENYKWDHGSYQGWVCADHITQMQIDENGIENIQEFIAKNSVPGKADFYPSKNGEGKIPLYHIGTTNTDGILHAVGGVLVGENPLNFDDWYFIDYATMKRVHPGDYAMDANNPLDIGLTAYVEDISRPGRFNWDMIQNLVKFDLQDGEATLESYKDSIRVVGETYNMPYVILDNPNDDKVHVSKLENIVVDAGGFPDDFVFNVNALDSLGYNSKPEVTTENTPLDPVIEYSYSDPTQMGVNSHSFDVTTKATIESGGIVNSGSSTYNVIVDYAVGVEDPIPSTSETDMGNPYPNPANGKIKIPYKLEGRQKATLEIYDTRGQLMDKYTKNSAHGEGEFNVNLSKYGSGVYITKFQSKDYQEMGKFIKKK